MKIHAGAALAVLLFGAPAMAAPLSLTASTGVDHSSGTYGGTTRTNITVVPFSLRATQDRLKMSATLPYIRIDGATGVVGGGSGGPIVIDPKNPAPATTRSGLGDLNLSLGYGLLRQDDAGFDLDLTGKVKLPTGSADKGLSTGKADVGASLEVSRTMGKLTPFASVGYRVPGDPAGTDLRNTVSASLGASAVAGKAVLIGSYDYSGRSSSNAVSSHSLFGAVAVPANDRFTLTGYGSKGLSDGAPDYGVGLLLSAKLR